MNKDFLLGLIQRRVDSLVIAVNEDQMEDVFHEQYLITSLFKDLLECFPVEKANEVDAEDGLAQLQDDVSDLADQLLELRKKVKKL